MSLTLRKASGLAPHVIEEPVALFDPGELVSNDAEEGPSQKTSSHRSLGDASHEKVNVVHVSVRN